MELFMTAYVACEDRKSQLELHAEKIRKSQLETAAASKSALRNRLADLERARDRTEVAERKAEIIELMRGSCWRGLGARTAQQGDSWPSRRLANVSSSRHVGLRHRLRHQR